MEENTTSSILQPYIPQADSPSGHDSAASDTKRYPSDASFTVSPFLGLGAKLSQAFASYTVVFLLISAYRLFLTRNSVDTYTANAKQVLASDCHTLEKTATNLASIPHFAAQSVNNGLVTVLDSTVSQIGYGLEIVLAGFLSTMDFVIGILTGTWRCFLENLANSEIPLFSEIGAGGVEAVDQMHDAIMGLLSLPLSDLGEIIRQRMENPQIEQFINLPVMPAQKIEFCAKALDLVVMDKMRDDLQRWILYGTYAILTMALLTILVNMVWIAFLHKRSKVHLKRIIRQLEVLSEISNGSARKDPKRLPPPVFEGMTVKILKYCALRVSYMTRHPFVFRFVDWSSKRLFPKDREKQSLYFWFVHYVANPQAVACLFIGLYGLIFVYCQIAIIDYAKTHYRPVLMAVMTDVSDVALEAVNSAMSATSRTFANKTNTMLLNLEVNLNINVFSDITQAAGEINTSLLQVQATLVQGIQAVFGNGAFGKMVLTVLQCLLLNKLAVLEAGLVWIQQNARIVIPRLPDDILMIEPDEMSKLVLDAVNGIPGSSTWNSSGVIDGVFNKFEEEQRQMLPVYYGLVGLWFVILVMGIVVLLRRSLVQPTHGLSNDTRFDQSMMKPLDNE
ncbi:plasma membrane fusion protein prm1 [Mortierella sp. AD094]|nr:plasma membrane fusion protein prm1 [Mortierella sp. AD094]